VFVDRDRGRPPRFERRHIDMTLTHPHRRPADDPTTKQTGNRATEQIDERTEDQSATIEAHR